MSVTTDQEMVYLMRAVSEIAAGLRTGTLPASAPGLAYIDHALARADAGYRGDPTGLSQPIIKPHIDTHTVTTNRDVDRRLAGIPDPPPPPRQILPGTREWNEIVERHEAEKLAAKQSKRGLRDRVRERVTVNG